MKKPVLSTVVLACLCANAMAQDSEKPDSEAEVPTPPPTVVLPELVAPYDDKLLRLSEVLGSIHYLRELCGAKEGNKWRDTMSAILIAEKPGPKRKARLIAHFNRGFRAFNGTYSACTDSALLASQRYVKEGAQLSAQITGRYGR